MLWNGANVKHTKKKTDQPEKEKNAVTPYGGSLVNFFTK
jgi:hypothetical protein